MPNDFLSAIGGEFGIVGPGQQNAPASPGMALGALGGSTAPTAPSPLAGSAPLGMPREDLSGEIKYPGFKELWPLLFFGADAVNARRQRLLNERSGPVLNKLIRAGEKALQDGDEETINQVVVGMSQLAGNAPHHAKAIESYIDRARKKQVDTALNKSILDIAGEFTAGDDRAQRLIGSLTNKVRTTTPEMLMKSVEKLYPEIKTNDNWVETFNAVTGRYEKRATPTMLSPEKASPETKEAFTILGVGPQAQARYYDTANAIQSRSGNLKAADVADFLATTEKLTSASQHALQLRLVPPASMPGVVYGTQGNVGGMLGFGPGQQTAATNAPPSQGVPPSLPSASQQRMLPQAPRMTAPVPSPVPENAITVDNPTYHFGAGNIPPRPPGPGASREEIDNYNVRLQAWKTGEQEEKRLQAELANKPLSEDATVWMIGKNGKPQEVPSGYMTIAQAKSRGFYVAADERETKYIREWHQNVGQGEALRRQLLSSDKSTLDSLSSKINRMVAKGIKLPIDTIWGKFAFGFGGPGLEALSSKEQELYNKFVAFGQAAEGIFNPDGKANAQVEQLKSGLIGALTSNRTAITTVNSILETAYERMRSRIQSQEGSNPGNIGLPQLNNPNAPSQGGTTQNLQESITGETGLAGSFKSFGDFIKSLGIDPMRMSGQMKSYLEGLWKTGIPSPSAPTGSLGAGGRQRRAQPPHNTSGPINKEAVKSLGKLP